MKKLSQKEQVIQAMRNMGCFATLKRLYEVVDFSTWKTKTPHESIRRILQLNKEFFKIQPGLWALESDRQNVLEKLNPYSSDNHSDELFSHSYYQGLLTEIGSLRQFSTFIPAQDQNKLFLGHKLKDIASLSQIPAFTFERILRKARTIDVIWFNSRRMPSHMYEVEHTTDIKNSLSKFYELQDFRIKFFIVAAPYRKIEFQDKISASIFQEIHDRVEFLSYERVANLHSNLAQQQKFAW